MSFQKIMLLSASVPKFKSKIEKENAPQDFTQMIMNKIKP